MRFFGFSFDDQSKLQDHIDEIHLKLKSFQCEKCQRCFRGKFHLENHMNNIHANLFKCSECESSFSIISKLKRHENEVHLKAKRSEKDNLDLSQKSKVKVDKKWVSETTILKNHINKAHSKAKCQPSKLTINERSKVERNFQNRNFKKKITKKIKCADCDDGFETQKEFENHMKNDHLKSFMCNSCPMFFKSSLILRSHFCEVHM